MSKQKTFEVMNYEDFLTTMKDLVKQNFGDEYKVELKHITKNNSVELDSLIILKQNERITPNIYLNLYYQSYMEGVPLDRIKNNIINTYSNAVNDKNAEELYIQYEFEEMKSCIIYRLVNFEKNQKLLQEIPHIRLLDLAITFHCLVKNNEDGIGTIRITNEHMNNWDVNIEKLAEYSKINTPLIFPAVIKTMNEIIVEILKQEIISMGKNDKCNSTKGNNAKGNSTKDKTAKDNSAKDDTAKYNSSEDSFEDNHSKDNSTNDYNAMDININNSDYDLDDFSDDELELSAEKLLKDMLDENGQNHNNEMYVISNSKGINGASCLLYPEVVKSLSEDLQSDLYILPSSIHEIILVRDNGKLDKNALKEMVTEVNNTQVPEEEILSESVYFYSRQRDAITMI
jgi:hypothetical protein